MTRYRIALLIYGTADSGRNALAEEKYRKLAEEFSARGIEVQSVLYHDSVALHATEILRSFHAVLVWINPVEQELDRHRLDTMLVDLADRGIFVSAHPETILRMGTKDVLYATRQMDWGGDTRVYKSFEEFANQFPGSLQGAGTRVLKQYRGNGGNGVYKVIHSPQSDQITVIHAKGGQQSQYSRKDFLAAFNVFFSNSDHLVDQEWNNNIRNGMLRCYLSGTAVAGFGYQEINALYETEEGESVPPGQRYYYTENCGLFRDLKEIMEKKWVPELLQLLHMEEDRLPVIWDADFFINDFHSPLAAGKYSLCEINVSSVSPFPPSAVKFIVDSVSRHLSKR